MDIEARLTSLERSKEDTLDNLNRILGVEQKTHWLAARITLLEVDKTAFDQRIRRLEEGKKVSCLRVPKTKYSGHVERRTGLKTRRRLTAKFGRRKFNKFGQAGGRRKEPDMTKTFGRRAYTQGRRSTDG